MAACQQMQIKSNETSYEASTFVYKWLGKDFHAIQQFTTYNAQKIATFRIGNSHFLAVANNRNDRGESNVFSEVFKYDLEEQKFVPHQRIASKSANDVKFFGFAVEHIRESFLVIANYFDEGKILLLPGFSISYILSISYLQSVMRKPAQLYINMLMITLFPSRVWKLRQQRAGYLLLYV